MPMKLLQNPVVRTTVRDAALVVAGCAAVGLAFNGLRPSGGIPVIQREAYDLLVPCPDISAEVDPIEPTDARLGEGRTLVIDAREPESFAAWHHPAARNVVYDYLDPIAEEKVREFARSGAAMVAVYGDGADPDSGRELAKELASKGIRNVYFVRGGAPALRERSTTR
ncbi:MAG: rhodanese-like domain-containing protein [Myxococcales bacterium]|jgi:hypothetical protein